MSTTINIPLTLIVATTKAGGIGLSGALPWPMIKGEMAYFARVTKRIANTANGTGKQNAVIMGRSTYLSIPPKFRPLSNRLNVVLSRRGDFEVPKSVLVATSFEDALKQLETEQENDKLGRVFIIGGEDTYRAALQYGAHRILCTRVQKNDGSDWECDRWFPLKLWNSEDASREDDTSSTDAAQWQRLPADALNEWVGESIAGEKHEGEEEKEVLWEVGMWERTGA